MPTVVLDIRLTLLVRLPVSALAERVLNCWATTVLLVDLASGCLGPSFTFIKFCCMPVELLLACLELHILIRASFLAANSATFCCKLALVVAIRDSFLGDTTKLVLGHLLDSSKWLSK